MVIVIILLLILLNAFFVIAEISVVSSRKSKLDAFAQKGNKTASEIIRILENPSQFLSTVQVGITLIGILTGIYSGDVLAEPLAVYLEKHVLIAHFAEEIAVTIVLIPITFVSIMLGELIPKRIGLTNPERYAIILIKPITYISKFTFPFIKFLESTTDFVLNLFNVKKISDAEIIEDEIKSLVEEGMAKGTIEEIEQDIVENVFQVGDRKISSLMTHSSDITYIETEFTIAQLQELLSYTSHSFYPVKDSRSGEVVGVVRVKQILLNYFINKEEFSIEKYLKPALFISESMLAYSVLEMFRSKHESIGIIIDEYGMITGIVTLNDILDAIVGDLDVAEGLAEITDREDGSWLIDAQIPFEDFCSYFEINIQSVEEKGFNTLGGLVLDILQHIPTTGEKVQWRNFTIEVVDMDGMRIDKLLIIKNDLI